MRSLDPYRILFPMGIAFAVTGTALWPLHALGRIPYPGPLHWTLMIQGFQHSFILGFLLTALPSFMHAERCRPPELAVAALAMIGFGVSSLAGWNALAQGFYLTTLLLIPAVAARRLGAGAAAPPTEFLLVALGLALGLLGGSVSMGAAAGWWSEPSPRFGLHLISMGMVLSLVLGVGGLLVPTFSAMREPLAIPGLAGPRQRAPRRVLYALIGAALVAALILEARGKPAAGAVVRAAAGVTVLLWVWKLFRRPGARDAVARTIWTSGWFLLAGLVTAAIVPARVLLGAHLMFIGGFGLLTLGIATRVVIRHGGHRLAIEQKVLHPGIHVAVALALTARLLAELDPAHYLPLLGASGTFWTLAWAGWGLGALPCILRTARPAVPLKAAASP